MLGVEPHSLGPDSIECFTRNLEKNVQVLAENKDVIIEEVFVHLPWESGSGKEGSKDVFRVVAKLHGVGRVEMRRGSKQELLQLPREKYPKPLAVLAGMDDHWWPTGADLEATKAAGDDQ